MMLTCISNMKKLSSIEAKLKKIFAYKKELLQISNPISFVIQSRIASNRVWRPPSILKGA